MSVLITNMSKNNAPPPMLSVDNDPDASLLRMGANLRKICVEFAQLSYIRIGQDFWWGAP